MPDYRIYEIGQDGHIVRLLIELTLPSDVIAIAYAERLPTVEAIEIWEGERLLRGISCKLGLASWRRSSSVGQCGGRTRCDGCGDCELSRSAVHVEEWDTRD